MEDGKLDKVYKGLNESWHTLDEYSITGNPFDIQIVLDTIFDALELLKKQDAKPMIENERGWNCPSCGLQLIEKTTSGYPCNLIDLPEDKPIKFCPMCGQAVKWE